MTGQLGALEGPLAAALEERRAGTGLRRRTEAGAAEGAHIRVGGRRYVNLAANDYLGLASHPQVREAFTAAVAEYGVGAGASHLVTGHRTPHARLEGELAGLCGQPRALVFSTGYMANQGVLATLCPRHGAVFADRLNHASLVDGARLAPGRQVRYRHRDVAHLRARLDQTPAAGRLIATDGVFSMDGDLAPLPELMAVAREYDAALVVDDAHGFGVLGEEGGGSCEHYRVPAAERPVLVGTLGKAFGVFGAFVAGSDLLVESLIQHARSYIYTTALPPAVAAAALAAVRIARAEPERRRHLARLVARLKAGARERRLRFAESATPIQPYIVGDAGRALALAAALRRQGFWVTAIRPPTVPRDSARLRVSLSAALEEEHVDGFLDALGRADQARRP